VRSIFGKWGRVGRLYKKALFISTKYYDIWQQLNTYMAVKAVSNRVLGDKVVMYVGKYPIKHCSKGIPLYKCRKCGMEFDVRLAYLEHKSSCDPYPDRRHITRIPKVMS
jgi:hypothetical protein